MYNFIKVSILAMFLTALTFTFSFAQLPWTKDNNNPVLTGGSGWNRHLFWPCVLYNSDSARYEMWFSASQERGSNIWRPFRIGFATSPDGLDWTMHPDPVLVPDPGAWDASTVEEAVVIRENGQYRMWYIGWRSSYEIGRIGYATSPNGINWIKDTLNNPVMAPGPGSWQAAGIYSPEVLPYEGGYKMWYSGWSADFVYTSIGLATSPDGINWTLDTLNSPVLTPGNTNRWDDGGIWNGSVLLIDGLYHMWYTGTRPSEGLPNSIGWATSDDGLHWNKYNDPATIRSFLDSDPVLRASGGKWDELLVHVGAVIFEDDQFRMWYTGTQSPTDYNGWRVGHATAALNDILIADFVADVDSNRVHFSDSSRGIITSYIWDFGDGQTSSEINPFHVYDSTGSYAVSLTITGPYGSHNRADTVVIDIVSGIEQNIRLAEHYYLSHNYPNPFNPKTNIEYQIANAQHVELSVYNLLGQKVATLVSQKQAAGNYNIEWDASNFSSGIYYYKIQAGEFQDVKKMVVLK